MTNNTHIGRKKTHPITFRLPEDLVNNLRNEAENENISLNTLVNQIFDRYTIWERHGNKIGLIPLTRPFIKEVLQNIPDDKIKEIAHNASKDALTELVLLSKGHLTIDSFISVFSQWLKASWMVHRYDYDGKSHHFVIHHDLGKKWSFYLSELLTAAFDDLANVRPNIEVRKDGLSFSISSSRDGLDKGKLTH